MEQDKEKTPPSSAGCDTDRCENRDNSAQRDERKEKRKESFRKHKGSQRSITEEWEIADEEISAVHRLGNILKTIGDCDPGLGSRLDSAMFLTEFDSNVTSHNTPKAEQSAKGLKKPDLAMPVKPNILMALRERISRESEPCSPALSSSSSSHLSSLLESLAVQSCSDSTPSYSQCNRSLTNIIRESLQKGAFLFQSQSEPGVYHSFVGEMGSPITAEQRLIRKKTAADKSKPQSKVSSTSPVTSAEMLRDPLKDSTPGTPAGTKCMNFVPVLPKYLAPSPFPLHSIHHAYQSSLSVSPPPSEPSFILKQSEKQRTADEKFSEDEVKVKLPGQSVDSLPHNSSSRFEFSICGLHDCDSWNKPRINSTLSSSYRCHHHHHQQQQQQQQQQLKPISCRPVYNKIAKRRGVEKRNQVSPSTSVHHVPSISDVLGAPFHIYGASASPDDILDQPPSALTETGMKNKASSAAGDTTAVSQDNAEEMEGVTGPSTLQPSTSNDDDSDFSTQADAFSLRSLQPESESGGDRDAHVEMEAFVTAVNLSVTNTLPTHSHLLQTPDCFRSRRASSCLPRSHSVSSLCQTGSAENKILRRTKSLPNKLLKSSFVEFTPDITDDGNDESYRFLCSCPGLYQCKVTGLVFHMDGEGEVVYRVVPWNRRLLAQHHKQPAGPLFDIKCLQQSVCQLHLPHCEIRSTGGCEFLSVAHVHDEGIEFISPHQITDTHVIINITGFSGFGNVKDEDSPPDPVRALVLLFYKPPAAPDVKSLLNVLMLPSNVVLQEVQRTRKKLVGDENYIETSSRCKLHPQQEYTLSTCPEDESVRVQPKEAEFECDNYDNYIPSFQVNIKKILGQINLFLRDSNKHSVWEREVWFSSTGVKRSCVQGKPTERLLEIWSSFVDGISGPVLKDLLDRLLEKTVITDSERESADAIQVKSDKARFVIDTVRKKGEAASSEMIEFLCKIDNYLCEHLGLI